MVSKRVVTPIYPIYKEPGSLAPMKKDHLRPKPTVNWTNNHLGWELGGTGGLGVGSGDLYMEMFVLQWTNNHLGWELGGTGGLGVGTGDLYMKMFNEQTTI